MRTVSYRVCDLQNAIVPMGFAGENLHRRIVFKADDVYAEYPHAAASLTVRPPYGEPYPAVVARDGNNVVWTVKDSDLTRSGQGELQLSFTTGEIVAKTYVGKTKICRSIQPTGDVPDPLEDFLTEAGAALTAIPETIAHEFEAIQAVAQTLEPGSQATAHFDGETKQLEIGVPEGEKGDPGYTPRRGVDYWTEADQAAMRQDIADDTTAARQAIAQDKAAAELAITQDKNAAQQAISEDRVAAITVIGNKGTEQVDAVTNKGAEVLASIPSDYTELSEDVSGLKSAINVLDNNALIAADTEKAFSHTSLQAPQKITFYGSSKAFDTAHYANKKRFLNGGTKTWNKNEVAMVASGCFITMNGTATGTDTTIAIQEDVELPAGTYKIVTRMSGTAVSASSCKYMIYLKYDGESSYTQAYSDFVGGASFESQFTTSKKAISIRIYVGVVKDYTYDNYIIWTNLYPSDTTIVDTETTVQADSEYEYTSASIGNLEAIDTMVHESTVTRIVETKEYVDNHIPDITAYWNDNIYALPEKFGAVGDGVANDTQALLDCIAYSASSGKPVRGYGKYKSTSKLLINTRYQDVFLRYLVYTGNEAAVQLSERYITFGFDTIESSGVGILFQKDGTKACQHIKVNGNIITSTGDCIRAKAQTYYVTIDVRNMVSSNANCINADYESDELNSSEYVIRDCSFGCPNGWVAYKPFGYKFYGCTVEGGCKNGYLDPINCTFIGCRHREFIDSTFIRINGSDPSRTNGPLFKFTVCPTYRGTHGMKYITADRIPWHSIDVSEIKGYDDITYVDEDSIVEWHKCAYNGQDVGCTASNDNQHSFEIIGEKIYFIGNNKVFAPGCRTTCVFDKAEYDMTLFESQTDEDILAAHNQGGWGTDFITGYSHTDYYMNASFGAVGYNDLTVTQENGNTCKIYDKLGNVLFDGTNAGNGKWSLKCIVDRTSTGRLKDPPNYLPELWWCYDGTNETWEIEKLS